MQEIEQLTQEGRHIVEAEEKGKKLVEAVEKLGEASRLLGHKYGQEAPECIDGLILYGRALVAYATSRNQVMPSEEVEEPEVSEEEESNAPQVTISSAGKVIQFDQEPTFEEEEEEEEEEEGKQEEGAEEEEDDFGFAWEMLDLARLLLDRHYPEPTTNTEIQEKRSSVHLLLGDISMETENFDQAIQEYESTVRILDNLFTSTDRRVAEAHYKYALALEYGGKKEEALKELDHVTSSLKGRLESLKGKDKGEDENEIKELEQLLEDLLNKREDLQTAGGSVKAQEAATEALAAELQVKIAQSLMPDVPVNDISSLVKKKRPSTEKATADDEEKVKRSKVEDQP
ncbi:MAG: hypothetical protein DHS80DRAFT_12196 [Piptocephalis tieghemiana]|nr:MAG: hypothetical protein DHS80DRAFT_12196 [Piptocephalis tieghemiana]